MSTICPLLLMAAKQKGELVTANERDSVECLKTACAWYVLHEQPFSEGCAIQKISDDLKQISLSVAK